MLRQSFVEVFFTEALIFPNIQTLCSSRTSKIRYIILLSNDYNDVPHAIYCGVIYSGEVIFRSCKKEQVVRVPALPFSSRNIFLLGLR